VWDALRGAQATLAMGLAEAEVARDRVRMAAGEGVGRRESFGTGPLGVGAGA